MSELPSKKLTIDQAHALRRIRDLGSMAWCEGVRARSGGAVKRMFKRMVDDGLCTGPPYQITTKGRGALGRFKWPTP